MGMKYDYGTSALFPICIYTSTLAILQTINNKFYERVLDTRSMVNSQ